MHVPITQIVSKWAKITFDDTSYAQTLQYVANYFDFLTQQLCSIVIGGSHDITKFHFSRAHLIVDLNQDSDRHMIVNFPDSQLIPHPVQLHKRACVYANVHVVSIHADHVMCEYVRDVHERACDVSDVQNI